MCYVSRSSTDYQIQDSGHFQSSLFIAFQTQISSLTSCLSFLGALENKSLL